MTSENRRTASGLFSLFVAVFCATLGFLNRIPLYQVIDGVFAGANFFMAYVNLSPVVKARLIPFLKQFLSKAAS